MHQLVHLVRHICGRLPGPPQLIHHTPTDSLFVCDEGWQDVGEAAGQLLQPARAVCIADWTCSPQQKRWMKMELQDLGLWPGSCPVRNPANTISLWRLPPQPELIETVADLPSPNFFQLHPFFIWNMECAIMSRLRNNYSLPCLHECAHPQVVYLSYK